MREVNNQAEWDSFFMQCERPYLSQSWVYGESKRAEKWFPKHFAFEYDEEVVAICMVLEKHILGFNAISRISRGPLFLKIIPSKDVRIQVLKNLRNRWKYFTNGLLFIAPALDSSSENIEIIRMARFWRWSSYKWHSSLINLNRDEKDMRKALGSRWKNRLNSAERSLVLKISSNVHEVEWMLERYVENMKEKKFSGPSIEFLKELYRTDPDQFIVLQALYENQPVAGYINLKQGPSAEIIIGWVGTVGREFNAGNFLFWNSSIVMKQRGCRLLDLGGFSIEDRYGRFKRGMNGDEYELSGEYICF